MSLFLQLGLVFVNHRARPRHLLMEIIYVLTCVKPGVYAYRVAVNAQREEDSDFDPQQELLITKGIEMFAESIPGCVLQVRPRARAHELRGRNEQHGRFGLVETRWLSWLARRALFVPLFTPPPPFAHTVFAVLRIH